MENKIIQPKILKGFRDISTQSMIKRNYVLQKIRQVVESFGFDPLETPTLEYEEILLGNIGEDEKLIYKFTDDGGRNVAMRYDQTVGACRYIAMNYNALPMPFKRYQVQTAFRAENTQKGRFREFLQFDADIFGVDEVGADIEMILLTSAIYKELGFVDFRVNISDRKLVEGIPYPILAAVDKIDKIGKDGVIREIQDKGFDNAENLVDTILNLQPNERITAILDATAQNGYGKNVIFDPSIMRSFSYSTGTIWEVKVDGYRSSLLGGERFDSLISRFSKVKVPGVGFGLGFDRTIEAMEEKGLIPEIQTNVDLLISVFDEKYIGKYYDYANNFRKVGINTEVYSVYSDKLGKQFKYADKKGIKYVLVLGDNEVEKGIVSLKNMKNGEQMEISLDEAVEKIKNEK